MTNNLCKYCQFQPENGHSIECPEYTWGNCTDKCSPPWHEHAPEKKEECKLCKNKKINPKKLKEWNKGMKEVMKKEKSK